MIKTVFVKIESFSLISWLAVSISVHIFVRPNMSPVWWWKNCFKTKFFINYLMMAVRIKRWIDTRIAK